MNIKITVNAGARRDEQSLAVDELIAIDGLGSDERFSDYLIDHDESSIRDAGITGGLLRLCYDRGAKQLYSSVTYQLERTLTLDQIEALKKYTIGQLSDGIGENLAQEYKEKTDIVLNLALGFDSHYEMLSDQ